MKLIVSTFLVYKVKKCLLKSGKVKEKSGASLPKALGTVTQDYGHPYPCTWVWIPVYMGMRDPVV